MILVSLFCFVGMAMAQVEASGQVVSSDDGTPVVGATVKEVGSSKGVITDIDGRFTIVVPSNGTTLEFSYIGMTTVQSKSAKNMRIALTPDDSMLEDVVVVAYGTQSKQSLTGSVSVVNSKKLEKRIGSNAVGALEGETPGVQVNNTYGEPGAAPSIRVRGFTSLKNNDPLYVVDGAPFDGKIGQELNPNDIESISILKDAASAALYGNRAANGVVIITTKKAKGNVKPSVELSVNHGWYSRGIKEYERLGADQWMEMEWQAKKNSLMTGSQNMNATDAAAYATANLIDESIGRNIYDKAKNELFDANGKLVANKLAGYNDLDWEDALERTGQRQEYNLSATTSGDKYNVYGSVGYLKENGYVLATDLERYTARVNSTFTPTKWFNGGINVSGSHTINNYNSNANGSYYANPFYVARYMAPVYPIYEHDAAGNIVLDEKGAKKYDTKSPYLDNRNVVFEKNTDIEQTTRNTFAMQVFGTITLPYGFSFTMKADMNNINNDYSKYDNPEIGDGASNNGRFSSTKYRYFSSNVQELINWDKSFGLHNISALLGHENYQWSSNYTQAMNTNMAVPDIFVLGNFLTNSYTTGYNDEDKTESYLARARYNYDEKYFVEASWRRDGSSRFHKDNRWGNFYSFGAAWNMKKEDWLKDVEWLDFLKVRASYGEVGNNAGSGLYGYMSLYEIDKNGGNTALLKASLKAYDVKWETTQTIDFGVEATFFKRLNVSLTYFNKNSKDLLFDVRLPMSTGGWSHGDAYSNMTQLMNIGKIMNRGFEFAIDGDIVKTKDWKWNLGLEGTLMKNEVKTLPNHEDILNGLQKYSEGHSIYEWFTYHYEGVDQLTGTALYTLDPDQKADCEAGGALVTINGVDYTSQVAFAKKDWCGSALPDIYGSIRSSLAWKDLSLDVLFTYSLGGKAYDGTYQSLMGVSESGAAGNSMHKDILNSWMAAPNGMTETSADRLAANAIPRLDFDSSSYLNATSDRWLTSASYLVCKNINLSYSLPNYLIAPLNLERVTLNAGVENLFTITSRQGLNPQYNFKGGYDDTYVTARVWNIGLKVRF